MAVIDAGAITSLIADLEALIRHAQQLPDASRAAATRKSVDELKAALPADVGGAAAGAWTDLGEDAQKSFFDKLDALLTELKIQLSPRGLLGSRALMSGDPTPTWIILLLLLLTLFGTLIVLGSIVERWDDALQGTGSVAQRQSAFALAKDFAEQASRELQRMQTAESNAAQALQALKDQQDRAAETAAAAAFEAARKEAEAASRLAQERWKAAIEAENRLAPSQHIVIVMVILLGTLGGLIHLASSLTMFVGNRDLKRSWTIYYVLAPVQGAALAPIFYLLLKSAVLSPQVSDGGGTQNLNLTAIYAFSGLTGLFAKQAIEKLKDVFVTLFAKIDAKDSGTKGAPAK